MGGALKCIESGRLKMSSQLRSFKAGARAEIEYQIQHFRENRTDKDVTGPETGVPLSAIICHVDHIQPDTFDRILRDFCDTQGLKPITVVIGQQERHRVLFRGSCSRRLLASLPSAESKPADGQPHCQPGRRSRANRLVGFGQVTRGLLLLNFNQQE